MFKKLREKDFWGGHPTYRGADLPDIPGQFMVLWRHEESGQWRLSLRKYVGTDMCYAFVKDEALRPDDIHNTWQVYDASAGEYKYTQTLRFEKEGYLS